jgi:hypothetical protein
LAFALTIRVAPLSGFTQAWIVDAWAACGSATVARIARPRALV